MSPLNPTAAHMPIRNIDIALLRTFIAVVEHGSLQRAADVVCRTQAAVSQQLKRLEDNVAIKLFQQNGRRLELTPQGYEVLYQARKVLKIHDDMLILLHARVIAQAGPSGNMQARHLDKERHPIGN